MFPTLKLHKSRLHLKTYTEEKIKLIGNLHVNVQYHNQETNLVLIVVEGDGPRIFGRNWLKYLRLDWNKIAIIQPGKNALEELLQQHQEVFRDELGPVSSFQASLQMKTAATPKFFKPRPVPFAIKEAIGCELDRMQKEGIEKIEHSEWAAPIVAVPKKKGCFCICGDYKVTINQNLAVD